MGLSKQPGATPGEPRCGTWWGFQFPRQPARTQTHTVRFSRLGSSGADAFCAEDLEGSFGRKRGVCRASSFETFLDPYLQEVGIRSITDTSSPLVAQAQKAKEPIESVLGSPSLQVSWNLPSVCRICVLFALRW